MSKISLRWRITLLMGALLLSVCVLLTALSIQNMTSNFVMPILRSSVNIENSVVIGEDDHMMPFDGGVGDLPDNTFYVPEIKKGVEKAKQSFSATSYLYMIFVVVGGMLVTYYLAGHAMRPISKLNNEISTIDVNNLSKRISVPQTKDEIQMLSASFNELLVRLEQDFEKEKRFSANVAHELKTPLATIMTSAQVVAMNKNSSTEDYREHVDITLQSVRRLSRVVDGLLLLGGATLEVAFEEVDVTQMLYEIEKELVPLYGEKNISLTYDLQPITFNGNLVLLYHAFFNLIENAWKYTGENGSITITSCDNNKGSIICITNTGSIPADDIQNIFEPFYRADKSRSRKIAGAGLGLSIAKEIFELHKMTISIRSEHGSKIIVEVCFDR